MANPTEKYPLAPPPPDEDSSVSGSSTAAASKTKLAGLAASLRLFSESMVRIEQAETEMAKAREASRLKAEKGRAELEADLTRMMAQTQLQMAAIVAAKAEHSGRKRKRGGRGDQEEEEDKGGLSSSARSRELGAGAMMLNLLQCNMFL